MATFDAADLLEDAIQRADLGSQGNGGAQAPLDQFQGFPNLPMELRIKIFKDMAPTHRVVQLEVVNGRVTGSSTPAPIPLHLDSEARREVMKMYHRFVPDRSTDFHIGDLPPVAIYFHPATDTIYFHSKSVSEGQVACHIPQQPFINMNSSLERTYITTLSIKDVEFNADFLIWILNFPNPEKRPKGFADIGKFDSLKKIQLYMAEPPTDSQVRAITDRDIPPFVPGVKPPGMKVLLIPGIFATIPNIPQQLLHIPRKFLSWAPRVRARRLFAFLYVCISPKVYDATNKPYVEILTHDGISLATMWDESYTMLQGTPEEEDDDEEAKPDVTVEDTADGDGQGQENSDATVEGRAEGDGQVQDNSSSEG
jgi:hypothetical protein